jgi:hypothetical protein
MSATPLLPCPTPEKAAYPSRGAALAGFSIGPQTGNHRPYRCRCGRWHMTSHPLTHSWR